MSHHARLYMLGLSVCMLGLAACVSTVGPEPTATAIQNAEDSTRPGVYWTGTDRLLWVTGDETGFVIEANSVAESHPFSLRGQGISFDPAIDPVVSAEGTVAGLPFRAADGAGGVALVREDEYRMAVLMYGGRDTTVSSINFLPEYGLTALGLHDEAGEDKIVAYNNYGMKQFEVSVASAAGELRYSVDEPAFMVLDRRAVASELELISLERPGSRIVLTEDSIGDEGQNLFHLLATVLAGWD